MGQQPRKENKVINKYEQQKQIRSAVHKDMEERVSNGAIKDFRRVAYPQQTEQVRNMLLIKKDLTFLRDRAGALDSWEQETIRRMARRVRGG